jgi:hypothetical protein
MATPVPVDDNKVVSITRAESPPPPEAKPDDFEPRYKARLDEDPEIKRLRERADRADALERELQAAPPLAPRPPQYAPRPAPSQGQQFDLNRWRDLARIDPGAAYLEMEALRETRRMQELDGLKRQTADAILQSQQYQISATSAHDWLKSELPEVFDGRSALQKRAVEIYNSEPFYTSRGDGHKLAAMMAASELGIVAKSKRRAESDPGVERDSVDQNVERGTKRPIRHEEDASDKPLSSQEKKIMREMGLDEKKFRAARKARREKKDVRVD